MTLNLTNNQIFMLLFLVILVAAVIVCSFIRRRQHKKNIEYAYHTTFVLDKMKKRTGVSHTNAQNISNTIIPDHVIRDMIPGIYLDKYFPESLLNSMPHRITRDISSRP